MLFSSVEIVLESFCVGCKKKGEEEVKMKVKIQQW